MAARLCACGCGREAQPGSKYATVDRCRQRAYRSRVNAAAKQHGVPAHLNLGVLGESTGSRIGDASAPARKPRKRNPDLRISYRKAVALLTRTFASGNDYAHEQRSARWAENLLGQLLTDKQRASLNPGSERER